MGKYDNRTGNKDLWAIAHNRDTFDITIIKKGQVLSTSRSNIDTYSPSDQDYELRLGNLQRMMDAMLISKVVQRDINTFIKTYIDNIITYISDNRLDFRNDVSNERGKWIDGDYDDTTLRLYFLSLIDSETGDSFTTLK